MMPAENVFCSKISEKKYKKQKPGTFKPGSFKCSEFDNRSMKIV